MAGSANTRTFFLLVSIAGSHCYKEFRQQGKALKLFPEWGVEVNYSVLYRVHEDGELLLVNCSQPHSPQPDGYNITCHRGVHVVHHTYKTGSITQTGHYRLEGWTSGNITHHLDYQLIVCAQKMPSFRLKKTTPVSSEKVFDVSSVEICGLNTTLGNGTTLRVYRDGGSSLVLDTSSSLEPLVEDLKGRLQLDLNSSHVILHGMSGREQFTCTIWKEDQCLSYRNALGNYFRRLFTHKGKNVTLPCISNGTMTINRKVFWTRKAVINGAGPKGQEVPMVVIYNTSSPQEVMYMLNGSQSGNYSLIIPAVSKQHSGKYECKNGTDNNRLAIIYISVCSQRVPLNVMFSHGERVSMPLTVNDTDGTESHIYWYRKKDLQSEEDMLYSSTDVVQMAGQLRGRAIVNRHNYTLTISNLTAEDSAVFTWRSFPVDMWDCCMEGSIRLVYRDPFGVSSPFYWAYSLLLGAVLLGLVAGVVWVNMRSSKGEPTSGPQSRQGQQSGDEDLYVNMEEAKDCLK